MTSIPPNLGFLADYLRNATDSLPVDLPIGTIHPAAISGLEEPSGYILTLVDGIFTLKATAEVVTVNSSTYEMSIRDHVILANDDAAGGVITVTLPLASVANSKHHIKKLGSTANVVVDGSSSERIDGALTQSLTSQYESLTVVSDGTNWYILS